ncbi:hypothetical protein GCM10028818_03500 [Spirosoma horti]
MESPDYSNWFRRVSNYGQRSLSRFYAKSLALSETWIDREQDYKAQGIHLSSGLFRQPPGHCLEKDTT